MLTKQEVKTLGVVGVVTYRVGGKSGVRPKRSDLVLLSSRSSLEILTLFKHLEYFLERTRKYIENNKHRNKPCVNKHIETIRQLWKLMNIKEKSKSLTTISPIRSTSISSKEGEKQNTHKTENAVKTDDKLTIVSMLSDMVLQSSTVMSSEPLWAPATKRKRTSLQQLKSLVIKNLSKLKRNEKKRSDWLQQVSEWRQSHINHPDYHTNHPEEQKFLKLESKINKLIQTLKMKHERYIENIAKLE